MGRYAALKNFRPGFYFAEDAGACWRQAAVHYLAKIKTGNNRILIDLNALPKLSSISGAFSITIQGKYDLFRHAGNAKIPEQKKGSEDLVTLKLLPEEGKKEIVIFRQIPINPAQPTSNASLSGARVETYLILRVPVISLDHENSSHYQSVTGFYRQWKIYPGDYPAKHKKWS